MMRNQLLEANASLIGLLEDDRVCSFSSLGGLLSFAPCFLEFGDKILFAFSNSLFDFLPSGWAILVFYSHDTVNDFVNLSLVFVCDFYSRFPEDMLKVPEIASHNNPLLEHRR